MIMWRTPSAVMTFVEGSSLTITNLGPEAAGVYQCFIINQIGSVHREVHLSIPVDYDETTNNNSVASAYSSIIDTFDGISSSSHTPSSTTSIDPIMTSSVTSSSSVSTGQIATPTISISMIVIACDLYLFK